MSEIINRMVVTDKQGDLFSVLLIHWTLTRRGKPTSYWTVLGRGVPWRSRITTLEAAERALEEASAHFAQQ